MTTRIGATAMRVAVLVLLAMVFAGGTAPPARAQPLDDNHVVKVTVTDARGEGQSATGFLWKSDRSVVTSLHAVLHMLMPGRKIEVFCNGVPHEADIERVLRKADLVLLRTRSPVRGCRVFRDEFRQSDVAALKPRPRTPLFTLGWKGAAATVTYRDLVKGRAGQPETLQGLVGNPTTLAALRTLRMPALDLDVYFVVGDSLSGGYSGGPVIDGSGRLIAVVDGGLDKGATDYSWLVPAAFLAELEARGDPGLPRDIGRTEMSLLASHFSAGLVAPRGVQTEVTFAPRPADRSPGSRYAFMKTKTRTLSELIATADPAIAKGIRQLLQTHERAVGRDAAARLRFDIFEDTGRGLIIAVPAGQPLIDGPVEGYPDIHMLRTRAPTPGAGSIQFEEIVADSDGYRTVAVDNADNNYFPEDSGYFEAVLQEKIRDCAIFDSTCTLDQPSVQIFDFLNGDKVLTFGLWVQPEPQYTPSYDYYSVAVSGETAFTAYARVHIWEGEEGLIQCARQRCSDRSTALTNLSHLVATRLTTFAGDIR